MRRSVTYPDPNRPGWWARMLAANTAPPPVLELEPDAEPEPPMAEPTPDPVPFDPQDWAWSVDVGMAPQCSPPAAADPEPIREPVEICAEPWPDEERCRQIGWRCDGGWVELADGRLWAIPILDRYDVITNPIVREYVADFVTLEPNPGMGEGLTGLLDYYDWCDEFAVRLSSVMATLIGINYTFPDLADGLRLLDCLNIGTWTDLVRRSIADVGREAVALSVARGVPLCEN